MDTTNKNDNANKTQNIDKHFVATCFGKAIGTYDANAIVQKGVAAELAALMRKAEFPIGANIYEVGAGTGLMTARLVGEFAPRHIVANDLCWGCKEPILRVSNGKAEFKSGDAETAPIPEETEAVVSCSTVHWFENMGAFFRKVSAALDVGGYFAFSSFGSDNLKEVREIGQVGLEYMTIAEHGKMLADAGFDIVESADGTERIFFPDSRALLRHFRATGVGGVRHDKWDMRETLHFCHEYEKRFRCARGLPLTYNPLYFVCVKSR